MRNKGGTRRTILSFGGKPDMAYYGCLFGMAFTWPGPEDTLRKAGAGAPSMPSKRLINPISVNAITISLHK